MSGRNSGSWITTKRGGNKSTDYRDTGYTKQQRTTVIFDVLVLVVDRVVELMIHYVTTIPTVGYYGGSHRILFLFIKSLFGQIRNTDTNLHRVSVDLVMCYE